MAEVSLIDCPTEETLATYVSGALDETVAESLTEHLHQCGECQRQVDQLLVKADSLVGVLRNAGPDLPETQVESNLNLLIDRARQIGPSPESSDTDPKASDETAVERRRPTTLPIDEFLCYLQKSRLLDRPEIDRLVEANQPTDSDAFARALVADKVLTPFQAKSLLRGVWKGLVLGNYVILEKLGQGGMGHVFKARHRNMGRVVCIKILPKSARKNPELMERFRREAQTVAALKHPNIVVGHDADEANGIHFLVMEYIDGKDLSRRVNEQGTLTVEQALDVTQQTARALRYAHEKGVVHRDIKPHNLLLDQSGTVKVLDMGIARFDSLLGENADGIAQATMTGTGLVMGTVDYMSPEQALNLKHADGRADIYSLGCTLYFLLNGQPLFEGQTMMEKLIAHREQSPPRLGTRRADVSSGLESIFARMVAKNPDERYASMDEVIEDLTRLEAGVRPRSQSVLGGRLQPLSRRMAKHWRSVVAASAVLIAAVIGWKAFPTLAGVDGSASLEGRKQIEEVVVREPSPPPIIGHPATLVNGGPGRVLLFVPFHWFYAEDFAAVTEAMKARGVEWVVASSKSGEAKAKHGEFTVPVDVTLNELDFDKDDYDGLIFLGGNAVHEFGHKDQFAAEKVKQIVGECATAIRVVASLTNGSSPLLDTGIVKHAEHFQADGAEIYRPKGSPASVVKCHESKYAARLIDTLLFEMGRRHARSQGGDGRAAIIVPDWGYDADEVASVRASFERAGIDVQFAAPTKWKVTSRTDKGRRVSTIEVDTLARSLRPDEFDAVVFCGGTPDAFNIRAGENESCTSTLVVDSLGQQTVVAGIGSGWDVLTSSTDVHGCVCDYRPLRGINVGFPKDKRPGRVANVSDVSKVDDLVALIFQDLPQSR